MTPASFADSPQTIQARVSREDETAAQRDNLLQSGDEMDR